MAVVWERVDPDGVNFVYDALPALGGGFTLGSRDPVTPAPDGSRARSDAEPDAIRIESAVALVSIHPFPNLSPPHSSKGHIAQQRS